MILALLQGACLAAPYIIAREINTAKEVPKFMGMLASGISLGTLSGGFLTGLFVDKGLLPMAMLVYAIPTSLAAVLVFIGLPNKKGHSSGKFDILGAILMSATIVCLLLGINMIGKISQGTASSSTVGLLLTGALLFGTLFVRVEARTDYPLIPIRLFKNRRYVCMLLAGGIAYFYLSAITNYAPVAVIDVMEGTSTQAGSLQIPRTIIILFLPAFAGSWVGRKKSRIWQAIAIAMFIVIGAMLPFCFIHAETSLTFLIVLLTITGIAESFRSVSITPGAQNMLSVKDMAVGTSLVTFMNTLMNSIGAAVNGILFDSAGTNIGLGIRNIFMLVVFVTICGFFLATIVLRRFFVDEVKKDVENVEIAS